MKRIVGRGVAFALPLLLAFSSPAYAATTVVRDAVGDSSLAYADIVHTDVVEQQGRGTLLFLMRLAAPIPEAPAQSPLAWAFHVDTAPGAIGPLYNEYIVRVLWSGGTFVGQVVNRATSSITGVTFGVDGTTVRVFVPLSALGNPSGFGWNAGTRQPPNPYFDTAPNGCDPSPTPCGLARWDQ
jgi:hypothetical protein